jgi:predicted nucleic acid-binding Zn ribbon protein
MSTDLTCPAGRLQQAIRFVVVNNRIPTDRHCTLCGDPIEKGYVRDSETRLIYCDSECFAGWACEEALVVKNRRKKAS